MHTRTDVPATAFPRRGHRFILREDIPASALPSRGPRLIARHDVPHRYVAGATGWSVATEWLGRAAAVIAVVLMVMVLQTISKGLVVQDSADRIVTDFRTANGFFDTRADLSAPKEVRQQLQVLRGVLVKLDDAAAVSVAELGAVLPIVDRLLAAGDGDVRIARELRAIAEVLAGSAGRLRGIASAADGTVSAVDARLAAALRQVELLNAQLERTTRKLAVLPAAGDAR